MVIINAIIYTMEDNIIENGYIRCKNNKISDIGNMSDFVDNNEDKIIDAKHNYVFPGLIDAHSHLGMRGVSVGFEDGEMNELSDPITPDMRAIDAINPMHETFKEAQMAGITSVVSGPGSTNPIGGQLAAIKTYGDGQRIDNMIIKFPVGMKMALGENAKRNYGQKGKAPVTRMSIASLIRELMYKTREYIDEKENGNKPKYNIKLEAMIPVIKKEIPIHFHCHRAVDIYTAIRIAKEFDINYVIVHCTDGHLILDELLKEDVKVISGPQLVHRGKPEVINKTFETPGILAKAGILTSITVDHPVTPIQFLPTCAAYAVKAGMDKTDALKAITINAAKIAGIDDRVGSLKVGKDADIAIFDGSPLDIASKIKYLIINGKVIIEENEI